MLIFGIMTISGLLNTFVFKLCNFKLETEKTGLFLLTIFLVPFFFCVSGVTYAFLGTPQSMILGSDNTEFKINYVTDSESVAAKWIGKEIGQNTVITDHWGIYRLIGQGQININKIFESDTINYYGTSKRFVFIRNNAIDDLKTKFWNDNDVIYDGGNESITFTK
jgi:hypothetical protein